MDESSPRRAVFTGLIILVSIALVAMIIIANRSRSASTPEDHEKRAAAILTLQKLTSAVIAYGNKSGNFPKSAQELVPEFLPEVPLDPYGRQFVFIPNGTDKMFVSYLGKDGSNKRYRANEVDIDVISTVELKNGKFSVFVP